MEDKRDRQHLTARCQVSGKPYKKFIENQNKIMKTWILPVDGTMFRVVLEKDTLDIWVNGSKVGVSAQHYSQDISRSRWRESSPTRGPRPTSPSAPSPPTSGLSAPATRGLAYYTGAVCNKQCAMCSLQCAVCSVQCAVCSVQCTVYSVQCALYHGPGHLYKTCIYGYSPCTDGYPNVICND